MIELQNKIFGAPHFTWHEALWLPTWSFHAHPPDHVKRNIEDIGRSLEYIRYIFGKMIFVTSWYRPTPYNSFIGGAKHSAHIEGSAVDFVVDNMSCDAVRERLVEELEGLEVRMEDLPGSVWVHIDNRHPGDGKRYFKP